MHPHLPQSFLEKNFVPEVDFAYIHFGKRKIKAGIPHIEAISGFSCV